MGFLGLKTFEGSADNFKFGMWVADRFGDRVPSHGHHTAHFVWAIFGSYETQAPQRKNNTSDIVVFNPAGTEHKDRFLSPGAFFSLKIFDDGLAPGVSAPITLDDSRVRNLFYQVCKEAACLQDDSSMIIEGLCYEALSMLGKDTSSAEASPKWIAIACELLREEEKPTITEVAREVDIHPTHFVRAFKKYAKCTPGEFRRLAKLQIAASKMAKSNLPIAAVAADAGYSDQSHFTKYFREAFGVTPGAFRKIMNL